MKPSRIAILIWCAIALLGLMCVVLPERMHIGQLTLRWTTIGNVLGSQDEGLNSSVDEGLRIKEERLNNLDSERAIEYPNTLFLDSCAESSSMWQYGGKYIFLATERGLAIINQHRAHACVLYRLYMEQLSEAKGTTQKLLFPDVLELSAEDMLLIAPMVDELRHIGFDLEQLGKTSYSIYGQPAQLGQQNGVTALRHILDAVRDTSANVQEEWRKQIAMALANDTAIPYGKVLSEEEMRNLIKSLFALPSYLFTPDGKRVVKVLTDEELKV